MSLLVRAVDTISGAVGDQTAWAERFPLQHTRGGYSAEADLPSALPVPAAWQVTSRAVAR